MIETRLIEYFLAVAREQNITKAAEILHISQPSLSKQMADLEKKLGKKLLIRGNKNTTLTEDGQYFRTKAEQIIQLIETTESSLGNENDISGNIFMGCAETVHMSFFSKIMKEISDNHPNIVFHVHSANANDVIDRIDKGLLDIGLLINPNFDEKHDYLEMPFYDIFGILVRKDDPLFQNKDKVLSQDIKGIPFIMTSQRQDSSFLVDWLGMPFSRLNIVAYYNLIYNATHMVEKGLGCSLSISDLVDTSEHSLLKFVPLYPEVKGKLYIVTKKYQTFSKATKLFLDCISERI
ncbi:MAG: LysR family transcriptional regulator [Bacilli bacterium]